MMYAGEVTRVDGSGVWALVPELVPDAEFGPLRSCATVEAGDAVLLADLDTCPATVDLVVVGVMV